MFKNILHTLSRLFATGLGIGYIPIAPGTFGTLLGAIILGGYATLPNFGIHTDPNILLWIFIAVSIVLIPLGTWSIHDYQLAYGKHDPKEVVIDEIAGFYLAIVLLIGFFALFIGGDFAIKGHYLRPSVYYFIVVYVLFRFFDIVKPWPINVVDQKMHTAWGVMLDDLLAGIYTAITFILFFYIGLATGWLDTLVMAV